MFGIEEVYEELLSMQSFADIEKAWPLLLLRFSRRGQNEHRAFRRSSLDLLECSSPAPSPQILLSVSKGQPGYALGKMVHRTIMVKFIPGCMVHMIWNVPVVLKGPMTWVS